MTTKNHNHAEKNRDKADSLSAEDPLPGIWIRSSGEMISMAEMNEHHLLAAYDIQERRISDASSHALPASARSTPELLEAHRSILHLLARHLESRGFITGDVACPYCGDLADLVEDEEVYGRSYGGLLYVCRPCEAWVGTHKRTSIALGTPAKKNRRAARKRAHNAFDQTWKGKGAIMPRTDAYAWMAAVMSLPPEEAHIGIMDERQCYYLERKAKELIQNRVAYGQGRRKKSPG